MICMQRSAHSCEICVELLAGISVLEYAFCTRHNSPLSRKDCPKGPSNNIMRTLDVYVGDYNFFGLSTHCLSTWTLWDSSSWTNWDRCFHVLGRAAFSGRSGHLHMGVSEDWGSFLWVPL